MTVRASGDDAELSLGYGLVSQLVAGAGTAGAAPGSALVDLRDDMDALTVGAGLLAVVNDLQTRAELVVVAVDDLHLERRPVGPCAAVRPTAAERRPFGRISGPPKRSR
jgi:hypothetical protein